MNKKRNKSIKKQFNKCVYTDESKRILKAIKELRKTNKTLKQKIKL